MSHVHLHSYVRDIFALAGLEPAAPKGPVVLARTLLGPDCIRVLPATPHRAPSPMPSLAHSKRWGWEILIDDGLSRRESVLAVGLGVARWYVRTVLEGQPFPRLEELGEHLVLPEPALLILLTLGYDVAQIASACMLPEHLVARRVARRLHPPLASVRPGRLGLVVDQEAQQ